MDFNPSDIRKLAEILKVDTEKCSSDEDDLPESSKLGRLCPLLFFINQHVDYF